MFCSSNFDDKYKKNFSQLTNIFTNDFMILCLSLATDIKLK